MKWPLGARSAGVHCGIKHKSADLGAIVFDRPVAWSGVFTTNAAAAAPVGWCRERTGVDVQAMVVNSGNANACTGAAGAMAVREVAEAVAGTLGCDPTEVLVASTGPIGVPLPVPKIVGSLPDLFRSLSGEVSDFARSIMTTDTTLKTVEVSAGPARLVGVAKGAAMIAPNMATMLAFLVTDAAVPGWELQEILAPAVERSFNRISIDACESTNDSVFLFSTGNAPYDPEALAAAVEAACLDLAHQIVSDAEGGTKVIEVFVTGARDEAHAVALARAVTASDLWRAAAHGGDPNWGRILSAMGAADRDLDISTVTISLGETTVFEHGEPRSVDASSVMSSDRILVSCALSAGDGSARFWCSDLSEEYVTLNAEVTT
ncbi:MAG: bifunctional glutamate N-acetyltransferase/amino-acid acetyltransferase ArgJ [Actinomycetota bacterium]